MSRPSSPIRSSEIVEKRSHARQRYDAFGVVSAERGDLYDERLGPLPLHRREGAEQVPASFTSWTMSWIFIC
jgi:hypothetical protein